MTQDLRRFLDTIEARRPELVLRVKQEVSAKWELSAIQKRLEADGKLPIIIFEKVAGYAMPVVVRNFMVSDEGRPKRSRLRREVEAGPVKEDPGEDGDGRSVRDPSL